MVILGGLELLAAGYLLNRHLKHKEEKQRLEIEALDLEERSYPIYSADDAGPRRSRRHSHDRERDRKERRQRRRDSPDWDHDRSRDREHIYGGRERTRDREDRKKNIPRRPNRTCILNIVPLRLCDHSLNHRIPRPAHHSQFGSRHRLLRLHLRPLLLPIHNTHLHRTNSLLLQPAQIPTITPQNNLSLTYTPLSQTNLTVIHPKNSPNHFCPPLHRRFVVAALLYPGRYMNGRERTQVELELPYRARMS
ncbi:hypothetical protein CJF30_00007157 [Rutstroemia sp. NJR-2017a BBW]|nr:hypothetical protein CJF30_00007157 [Rutstroemia sp. NJR-2017a BBW]